MNFVGLFTLWIASGFAMAFAACRFGDNAIKQLARPLTAKPRTPHRHW